MLKVEIFGNAYHYQDFIKENPNIVVINLVEFGSQLVLTYV